MISSASLQAVSPKALVIHLSSSAMKLVNYVTSPNDTITFIAKDIETMQANLLVWMYFTLEVVDVQRPVRRDIVIVLLEFVRIKHVFVLAFQNNWQTFAISVRATLAVDHQIHIVGAAFLSGNFILAINRTNVRDMSDKQKPKKFHIFTSYHFTAD